MTETEKNLLEVIQTSEDPAVTSLRVVAFLKGIAQSPAFFESCKALFESGDIDGMRKLIDSVQI